MNEYSADDICIVSVGCVLPGSVNPERYWENLQKGETLIKQMDNKRWFSDIFYDEDKTKPDCSYSKHAATVDNETLEELAKNLNIDIKDTNRLQLMTLESIRQCMEPIKAHYGTKIKPERSSLILGMMHPIEEFFHQHYLLDKDEIWKYAEQWLGDDQAKREALKLYVEDLVKDQNPLLRNLLSPAVLDRSKNYFNIQGESFLVDAACASALAAIDLSIKKLKLREVDVAFCGGLESNLSTGAFVLFCKVGALSTGATLPFDQRTDGLSQGEGAVVFALMRVPDALELGLDIWGVVKGCDGSTDGQSGSLFQPTVDGQLLAYNRVYANEKERNVDYIEAHGTGTVIGDYTELESLGTFFGDFQIPIGSVKAIVGHTKGVAGGAGLLKCMLMGKHKTLVASKYLEDQIVANNGHLFVNKQEIKLKPNAGPSRFAVSSFGFGGTNYHLLYEQFNPLHTLKPALEIKYHEPVICCENYIDFESFDPSELKKYVRIPPKSFPQIDKSQFISLYGVHALFDEFNIQLDDLPLKDISVVSSSCLGLDHLVALGNRLYHRAFCHYFEYDDPEFKQNVETYKERYPHITEDSGPGILNNVIAGRICNSFNFMGKSFNIDMENTSPTTALSAAMREVWLDNRILVLALLDEEIDQQTMRIKKKGVYCSLIMSKENCAKYGLPIHKLVEQVKYEQTNP